MSSSTALFISSLLAFFTIYSLGSLSALLSEKSGVVNIAIDGKMIIGGLIVALFYQIEGYDQTLGEFGTYLAIFIAGLVGMIYSMTLAYFTINLLSDQVITGTALNLIAPAFALLVLVSLPNGGTTVSGVGNSGDWAGLINTPTIIMAIFTVLILLLMAAVLTKTNFGLRLKSAGENPYALETAGISVKSTRWQSVLLAGFFSGVAGAVFAVNLNSFSGTVNGSGFISIAILILGQWSIIGITFFSTLFAVLIASISQIDLGIPSELANTLPFILPIVVLIFIRSTNTGPSSVGKPFKKDMR